MTTYGTIPTSVPPSSLNDSTLEFLSRAKDRIRSDFSTRRPWKEMAPPSAISLPGGAIDAAARFRDNAAYFRMNYAIIVLFVLFLSLLWRPISLIVFVVMMTAWFFFYFLRDEPLVVFNRTIGDRMVLISLSVATIVILFMTHATVNIVVGLVVGMAVVAIHGALRWTDDLVWNQEEGGAGSGVVWPRIPLKETASSSFSSS
ncbi:hypothetical protein U1Q18_018052 [Sarracenia purpurea var. burkii]